MPHFSKTPRKYLRYALTGLLMSSMVLVTGFLSFSGMLVLNDSIYLAIAAFFLAGVVEGEVYAQNISKSLLRILTPSYLKDGILIEELAKLRKNKEFKNNLFIQDYDKLCTYAAKLKESLEENLDDEEEAKKSRELEKTERSLKWMRRAFKALVDDKLEESHPYYSDLNPLLTGDQKETLKEKIEYKILISSLSWIVNIGAGISCGLVGMEVAHTSIMVIAAHFGITLSGTALSASVFGLAALGAIGYTLLIHNTINSMIQNDTLQKWTHEIKDFFAKKDISTPKKIGAAFLVGSILAIGIFATIATAGTWWYAAKAGAKMLPGITRIASELRTGAVSIMFATSVIFTIVNSLKSAKQIVKISLKEKWKETQHKIQQYRDKEKNNLHFYNPFRIIIQIVTFPFKILAFIGHLISMAVMGDKLKGVDPRITAAVGIASESGSDFSYLFPEKHSYSDQHKEKDPGKKPAEKIAHNTHHHDHQHEEDEEEHHHIDIMGKFLKLTLSPLYLLSALWDYYTSRLENKTENTKKLTAVKAIKKSFFGLETSILIEEPKISNSKWISFLQEKRAERAIAKRRDGFKSGEEKTLNTFKEQITANKGNFNLEPGFFKSKAAKEACKKLQKLSDFSQYPVTESLAP